VEPEGRDEDEDKKLEIQIIALDMDKGSPRVDIRNAAALGHRCQCVAFFY